MDRTVLLLLLRVDVDRIKFRSAMLRMVASFRMATYPDGGGGACSWRRNILLVASACGSRW